MKTIPIKSYVTQANRIVKTYQSKYTVEKAEGKDMPKKINVFLVGDSTACNWPIDYYPEEGYGKFLCDYFNENSVEFYNHSVSGGSTTTFLDGTKELGYWPKTAEMVKPGDFVIIDLGINDVRHTTGDDGKFSPKLYKANLKKMYNDVKERGGTVIFTAVAICVDSPNENGEIEVAADLREVAMAKKELAQELGCEFIDCQDKLKDFYNAEIKRLGSLDNMRGLYFRIRSYLMDESGPFALAYEDTLIPNNFEDGTEQDFTHSTVYGADEVAHIVYNAIIESNSKLKDYTK